MSDAYVPVPDAVDQQREDPIGEIVERGLPFDAPDADVVEQREDPNGDDQLDDYR